MPVRLSVTSRATAVVLAAVGAAAIIGALLVAEDGAGSVGQDRPVNVGATDLGDISAHNSPTIVRNPRDAKNLAVTSRVDSPDFTCALHVTRDGGTRWTRIPVPIPAGEGRKCFAPDAAFGPDGTLYVSWVTLKGAGNRPHAAWVATSTDAARTLHPPRRVGGPLTFGVRITADPGRSGRVYMTWLQARDVGLLKFSGPGNPILIRRSDDGGVTWSRPAQVNAASRGRVLGASPVVGPRGELYVLFLDVGDDRLDYEGGHLGDGGPPYPGHFSLVVARSLDRGATWQESVVDDAVVPTRRFISFLPPFPSLAVDPASGRLYVAFEDARRGAPDVYVWSLARGSREWSKPVRVNDTPPGDRSWQYLPRAAVAPGGRLDVVYYDRRADPANIRNQVALQSSEDGGASFGPRLILSTRAFDSRIGAGGERGLPDLGSRLGLVSSDDAATAAWTDTRNGTEGSNKQNIFSAVVTFERAGQTWRTILLLGGIVLVLVAVGALVSARVRNN